jgi:hypothetical protein
VSPPVVAWWRITSRSLPSNKSLFHYIYTSTEGNRKSKKFTVLEDVARRYLGWISCLRVEDTRLTCTLISIYRTIWHHDSISWLKQWRFSFKFERCPVRISAGKQTAWIISYLVFLQAKYKCVHIKLNRNGFVSHPVEFIICSNSIIQCYATRVNGSVVK